MTTAEKLDALAVKAAEAHTNLNVYGSVIALLEGGAIYGGRSGPAQRIIDQCKRAQRNELDRYDAARKSIARLGGGA